jgi:ferric-dicitrate binding protein FerR (iron transport regulator)
MVSVGWWLQTVEPTPPPVATSAPVPPGPAIFAGKQFVELPDGSTVILNEGSRLSYDRSFGDSLREVLLTGEAYFNVTHDAAKPFTVVTGNITTRVLGTSFNVTAYPDQQQVQVTVTRGKVQVNNDERLLGIITPDQQISVNTVTYDFVQRSVKAEQASAWQSQYLILDNVSLEEAATTIAQKYNVTIALSNHALKGCRISATFLKGENLEQVLTVVSGVVQATYSIDADGKVTIDGKGCL